MRSLARQDDVDTMIEMHERFLVKINQTCLLHNQQFQMSTIKIFDYMLEYCDIWRRGIRSLTSDMRTKLIGIDMGVGAHIDFTYKLLTALLNRNPSLHFQALIAVFLQ